MGHLYLVIKTSKIYNPSEVLFFDQNVIDFDSYILLLHESFRRFPVSYSGEVDFQIKTFKSNEVFFTVSRIGPKIELTVRQLDIW